MHMHNPLRECCSNTGNEGPCLFSFSSPSWASSHLKTKRTHQSLALQILSLVVPSCLSPAASSAASRSASVPSSPEKKCQDLPGSKKLNKQPLEAAVPREHPSRVHGACIFKSASSCCFRKALGPQCFLEG